MISKPFKISTGLKDLIGRDLITDDFVAVFELVKNSFDAHANVVNIRFGNNRIIIADDGKGMSQDDILNKWLFIAYSAKQDGSEDKDYRRRKAESSRTFAGSKGVGRFSCDRLGSKLTLSTKAIGEPVQTLVVDWTQYEQDPKTEFETINVEITESSEFPQTSLKPNSETGTILKIEGLRAEWDREKLQGLKRELMKLINPFTQGSSDFQIQLRAKDQVEKDKKDKAYNLNLPAGKERRLIVNGTIENPILEVLTKRTTAIRVDIANNGEIIESTLEDRGDLIYRIREPNPYPRLKDSNFLSEIFFLNRSAKAVFARRMGLPSVQFGSIFLFRNGFRVMPVGAEEDDFFGLNRRKQQGVKRFLGGRDLIGRVEVKGEKGFEEATSRDQGLIRTPEVEDLIECVVDKCVRRLERYVVDITWKDIYDKDILDTSRMKLDNSSALVSQLVSRLSATKGVEVIKYNPEIVRIVDDKSDAFESSLKALEILADGTGDNALISRVNKAKVQIKELQTAEAESRKAEHRAQTLAETATKAAATAEQKYTEEQERSKFLLAASSLDQDTILNLHHQIIMHASDVHHGIRRMMGKLRNNVSVKTSEWIDFLERISFRNSQILTASRFATKAGYKQQSSQVTADLAVYIIDYLNSVSSLWAPRGINIEINADVDPFERPFRPIEVGIVLDNLVSNAAKARASKIGFFLDMGGKPRPDLIVTVADDGVGWSSSIGDLERAFEKGITTTNGSGLGLFHLKQIIESMGGIVVARKEPYSKTLDGAQLQLRVPA